MHHRTRPTRPRTVRWSDSDDAWVTGPLTATEAENVPRNTRRFQALGPPAAPDSHVRDDDVGRIQLLPQLHLRRRHTTRRHRARHRAARGHVVQRTGAADPRCARTRALLRVSILPDSGVAPVFRAGAGLLDRRHARGRHPHGPAPHAPGAVRRRHRRSHRRIPGPAPAGRVRGLAFLRRATATSVAPCRVASNWATRCS